MQRRLQPWPTAFYTSLMVRSGKWSLMKPSSCRKISNGEPAVSPLDRKLLRDLWRIKGQAIAIGAVIGVGVLMLVMMTGLVTSLDETRRAYYERYRLADIFAPVTRAPERLIADLAAVPGVSAAEGRVTGSALIDLPGRSEERRVGKEVRPV